MTNSLGWLTFALFLPFLFGRGAAQVAPLIADINARQTTSLDGQWQAIVDPYDVGALDYRAHPLKNNNAFYKNYKPQSESELVEYDFDTSGQLHVPGDWNTQREQLLFYEGSVWYKRSFDYTKSPKNRLFLHFGACNYLAAVYLNGEELGEHEGGFTPFDFEITDRVKAHGNFLVLRINNTRGRDQVPTVNTDWWNYGGITRPVTWWRCRRHLFKTILSSLIKDRRAKSQGGFNSTGQSFSRISQSEFQRRVSIRHSKQIPEDEPSFPLAPT